jgi:hypothetical protein
MPNCPRCKHALSIAEAAALRVGRNSDYYMTINCPGPPHCTLGVVSHVHRAPRGTDPNPYGDHSPADGPVDADQTFYRDRDRKRQDDYMAARNMPSEADLQDAYTASRREWQPGDPLDRDRRRVAEAERAAAEWAASRAGPRGQFVSFADAANDPPTGFEHELAQLINRHSQENTSNTPDYILALYLRNCLANFALATDYRDQWHGFKPWPALSEPVPAPDEQT